LPKAEDVISLRPPTPDQLFQLKSEKAFQAILKAEASRKPGALPVIFPEAPAVQQQPYLGRAWPHQVRTTVPGYVCYNRLYFEQLNFERYGWDLGVLTPFLSAGLFYYDVAALPFHAAIDPCRTYECGVGYCAPGDPVPLMLYWSHLRNGGQNPCSPCEGK